MTIAEALDQVRETGSVQVENGRVKLRFPETERSLLTPALAVLRANREAVIERVSTEPAQAAPSKPSKPTLAHVDPEARGIPYATWRASMLNEIFRQHGQTGQPGRIIAATVQDGLEKRQRRKSCIAA